jgi:hypothetical protein
MHAGRALLLLPVLVVFVITSPIGASAAPKTSGGGGGCHDSPGSYSTDFWIQPYLELNHGGNLHSIEVSNPCLETIPIDFDLDGVPPSDDLIIAIPGGTFAAAGEAELDPVGLWLLKVYGWGVTGSSVISPCSVNPGPPDFIMNPDGTLSPANCP